MNQFTFHPHLLIATISTFAFSFYGRTQSPPPPPNHFRISYGHPDPSLLNASASSEKDILLHNHSALITAQIQIPSVVEVASYVICSLQVPLMS